MEISVLFLRINGREIYYNIQYAFIILKYLSLQFAIKEHKKIFGKSMIADREQDLSLSIPIIIISNKYKFY